MVSILSYAGFDIESEADKQIVRSIVSDSNADKEVRKFAVLIALKYSLISFSKAEGVLREIEDFNDMDKTFSGFLDEFKKINQLKTYDLTIEDCPLCEEKLTVKKGDGSFPRFQFERKCSKGHFNLELSTHKSWFVDFGLDDEDTWFFIHPYKNEKEVEKLNGYIQRLGGKPIGKVQE